MEDRLPDPRPQGVSIDPITQCRHREGQSAQHTTDQNTITIIIIVFNLSAVVANKINNNR